MRRLLFLAWVLTALATRGGQPDGGAPMGLPPCSGPEYRQFDFWVGSWRVTTPNGAFAGTNVITREMKGCVLHEHWSGSKGGLGESFNTFDTATKRWHQTWVDDSGTLLLLDGTFTQDTMQLSDAPKAGAPLNRITWKALDANRVRQLWETSTDGGKTWSTAFDGLYTRA